MLARKASVPDHCLEMNVGQTAGFTHAITFRNVFDNGNDFVVRKMRIEKNRTLALRKPFLAMQTVKQTPVLILAVEVANADISRSSNAVVGTLFIVAKKLR